MSITTITEFPRKVREIENSWIALSDGTRLAAHIWLPEDAEETPVPALLAYRPGGTHPGDALTGPYFAGHGYGVVSVDMRGTGCSDGLMADEYLRQEQDDALEVIAWIAQQTWCSGKLGLFGISRGGTSALQVAARKPPALKAVITVCSTDDRYEDDLLYKGGTVLGAMMRRSAAMLASVTLPPDPKTVGNRWRKMWTNRLENAALPVIAWLEHPHRVPYWKHGSVCEDFSMVDAPTLVVGGWNDARSNAVPRLMKGLRVTRKAIIGPWGETWPHLARPEPAIGFLQEALRWWDQFLKGESTGISREPDFRYFVMEPWPPGTTPERISGRWLGDSFWGFGHVDTKKWWLNANGIGPTAGSETARSISSKQTAGEDDPQSLSFDTPALVTDIDIVGQPAVELDFSADQPVAHVAVRLEDVWPSGEVSRISHHLQNLCFRDSREYPMPLEPGKRYKMKIKLDDIAWRVPKGHRIRVAISTACYPLMWPAPEPVTLTVYAAKSQVHLPLRKDVANETAVAWPEPQAAAPVEVTELKPPFHKRETVTDAETGEVRIEIMADSGEHELAPHGLIIHSAERESHAILPDDPLSAKMETHWSEERRRGTWNTRTETHGRLTVTKTHWVIWGKIEAFEGKKKVFEKEIEKTVPRLLQ